MIERKQSRNWEKGGRKIRQIQLDLGIRKRKGKPLHGNTRYRDYLEFAAYLFLIKMHSLCSLHFSKTNSETITT